MWGTFGFEALAFPLHGACLSALGCICRHGIDTAGHLLDLDALDVALHFAGHLEARGVGGVGQWEGPQGLLLSPFISSDFWEDLFWERTPFSAFSFLHLRGFKIEVCGCLRQAKQEPAILEGQTHAVFPRQASVRVSALRLLARLIPYAAQRQGGAKGFTKHLAA